MTTQSINKSFLPIMIILLLSSCSSIEIFKENTEVPIRRPYKSFVIINKEVGMRGFTSQFIDQQVQIHLQEALEAQGLVYDKTEPELVIRYTSNEDQRKRKTLKTIILIPIGVIGYGIHGCTTPTTTTEIIIQVHQTMS